MAEIRTLFCDIETYSSVNLTSCGVYKYTESSDFSILLFGYAFGDDPVEVIDLTDTKLPQVIVDALYDTSVVKVAHNSNFERTCLSRYLNKQINPGAFEDTMIMASQCGLPMSLDAVGSALGLSEAEAKMKEGKALVKKFCLPRKPTKANPKVQLRKEDAPEDWDTFIEYNRRDVEVERLIYKKLVKWRPDFSEHQIWALDQKINDNGIKVDLELVSNAIEMGAEYKKKLIDKAIEISGLENPNSSDQIKMWLEEQEGISVPSLNKKAVTDVISSLSTDKAKEFMALRSEFSKSSTKKYEAIIRSSTEDEHIKGCFQFAGAGRTSRWAGRLVQLQNLAQNHMEDLDACRDIVKLGDLNTMEMLYPSVQSALSELIRTALIPEDGHRFIVADYSAIEARVLAWIAKEKWRMDVFKNGGDIYCMSASQMFKVPVEKHGVNGHLRQKGKVAELACGYGGGVNALKAFGADKMGMTDEEMVETVDLWRSSSPHVVALWKSVEQAAIKATARKTSAISTVGGILFTYEDGVLWMTLPSGRRIAYWGAEYSESKFGGNRKSLTYMGTDQKTKKWVRLETFGGKLVENLTQATARDCLKASMLALDKAEFDIRAHVHDEVIITEPIGGRSVEDVCEIMGRPIEWAPGLLLRGDGYECLSYRKD